MEYSLAESLLLALSEVVIDLYHGVRERPRAFWATWTALFAIAALLLLRRDRHEPVDF